MTRDKRHTEDLMDRHLQMFNSPPLPVMVDAKKRILSRLRDEAKNVEQASSTPFPVPSRWPWGIATVAAATIVLVVILKSGAVQHFGEFGTDAPAVLQTAGGGLYRATDGQVIQAGGRIEVGAVVRTNQGASPVLLLTDGSRVEMRAQSELTLERADDGIRIHLFKGDVIVNAAKQRAGHLYVQTKEVTVSVVGTVFLVNAEAEGSRVAVIEGKVRVRQGATTKNLEPGEQVVTNPRMESLPAKEELSWSRNADAHIALLQQSAIPTGRDQVTPEFALETLRVQPFEVRATEPSAFEVATIKPAGPGRSPTGGTCRGTDNKYTGALGIPLPPLGECIFRGMTVKLLMQEAFDLHGQNAGEMVVGGPNWSDSDRYDLHAKAERPTTQAAMRLMLQQLLKDRFQLRFHRDRRELPGFALVVAKNGPKLQEASQDEAKSGIWRTDRAHPWVGQAVPMVQLATFLSLPLNRPVTDETHLTGSYNFTLMWTPGQEEGGLSAIIARLPPDVQAQIPGVDPNGPSIFTALQEQLGLRLDARKVPAEIYVIDQVLKPSEN